MIIKVKGFLTFRDIVGERQIQLDDEVRTTLIDILVELCGELDDEFGEMIFDDDSSNLNQYVAVLINGHHYSHIPDGLDTVLNDCDEVAIFPPIAGG